MARIQQIESDSSFNLSNVLQGKILTYKTYQNGRIVHKAKLHNGSVVEISPKPIELAGSNAIEVFSNSSGYTISLSLDQNTVGFSQGALKTLLTMKKLSTPQEGFAATYQLQGADGNPIGDKINIIQDILIQSLTFIPHATEQDVLSDSSVILNDPYLKMVCYVQRDSEAAHYSTVYIPVKELVDTYTAGRGLVLQDAEFSLQSDSFSDTAKFLTIGEHTIGLHGITEAIQAAIDAFTPLPSGGTAGQFLQKTSNSTQWADINLDNYYTKQEVDALVNCSDASYIELSEVTEGKAYLQGIKIPVGLETSLGHYYPIQKGSLQIGSDSVVLDIAPYLAYDGTASFTPTWKIWIAGGISQYHTSSNSADLSNYYTKSEVDQLIANISDSTDLSNYYTKGEVDQLIADLSNSVDLSNYYTKQEVDQLIQDISNSIDLSNYYTKSETEILLEQLSNSFNGKLQNFYDKGEVDSIAGALSDSIANVKKAFNGYYTKGQVDALILGLSDSITLDDYYTKEEVDALLEEFSNSVDLSGYYTKEEVNDIAATLSDSIYYTNQRFNNYFTKEEVLELLQDHSGSAPVIQPYVAGEGLYLRNNTFSIVADEAQDTKYLNIGEHSLGLQGLSTDIAAARQGALSDAKSYVDIQLQSYYDKTAVDALVKSLSDSINNVNSKFENYYTSSQVDSITQALSDSIQTVKNSFNNYYTKTQVDELFAQFSDSIDLSSYYTKEQVDVLVKDLSDSIASVRTQLETHVEEASSRFSQLSDSIQNIQQAFDNYYTKSEVDVALQELSDSLGALNEKLESYYTKGEVDSLVQNLSNSIQTVKSSFEDYYTKVETDTFVRELSNSLAALSERCYSYSEETSTKLSQLSNSIVEIREVLGNYYDKYQIDLIVDTLSNSIEAVKSSFQNYYTKTEVDTLLQELSDSVDLSDYYTKEELDPRFKALSDSLTYVREDLSSYKNSVNGKLQQFSNSLATVKSSLQNYYDKTEVDSFVSSLSNSIEDLRSSFDSYYTKVQTEELLDNYASNSTIQKLQQGLQELDQTKQDISDALQTEQELRGLIQGKISIPQGGTTGQFLQKTSDSTQWASVDLDDYYTKAQTDVILQQISNSIDSIKTQLQTKITFPQQGLPGDVLMLSSDSYGWSSLPFREGSFSDSSLTLDREQYGRWILTGTGAISLVDVNWQDGARGEVIVDTSTQTVSIPASWVVPDALWDAWTESPGVYCLQVHKEGGVVYAHALLPFSAYQDSSQEIPVNLSARLQAVQSAVDDLSDSLSALNSRVTLVESKLNVLDEAAWVQLQWAQSIQLSATPGSRQRLTLQGDTQLTAPTLSTSYPTLTVQISKTSQYSFTLDGITIIASQTTLLSWYWDGVTTHRLPIQYLGD